MCWLGAGGNRLSTERSLGVGLKRQNLMGNGVEENGLDNFVCRIGFSG